MKRVYSVVKAMLKTLGVVAGVSALDEFMESLEVSGAPFFCVIFLINSLIAASFDEEDP